MKKTMILFLFFCIPFWAAAQSSTKTEQNFSIQYRNAFLVGINYAKLSQNFNNESIVSFFYRNEYIRRLNHNFSFGIGFGFFSGQSSKRIEVFAINSMQTILYDNRGETSVSFLSFSGYWDILHSNRSLLRLGLGYSVRNIKAWYVPPDLIGVNFPYYLENKRINGYDNGLVLHLGYGYKISPNFMTLANIRVYTKGKYVETFSTAGLGVSYLF